MLGASPGSPFRSNTGAGSGSGSGHRAPWPPPSPSHHSAPAPDAFGRYGVTGGLYSLFPGGTETSAAIYSQATSTSTRFAHSANTYHSFIGSHKVADSLFSSGYSFGGPTPPPPQVPGPPFSPSAPMVERGITQLEMMAKGFNNNNNNNQLNNNINGDNRGTVPCANPAKKLENKRRTECELFQEPVERRQVVSSKQRRWEQATAAPTVVKNEVTSRPSCGCRRTNVSTTSSPAPLSGRGGIHVVENNTVVSYPDMNVTIQPPDRKKVDGGCSRTNPVALRSGGEWQLQAIKKEPGATPCQVAEVTTSISPLTAVVKLEAVGTASSCAKKDTQHQHSGANTAVLQPQCEERVTNGIAPWAATTTHNSALTPPTLWQYPAPVPVQLGPSDHMPLPPVGYQLVRDPITGHFLLIPATNIEHLQRAVLWPNYPTTLQPSLHMATQPTAQHIQLFESTEPGEFLNTLSAHGHNAQTPTQTARILVQPQLTLTAAEPPLPKRKAAVIKVEAADCTALEVKAPAMSRPTEVSVTATATQVFPNSTGVTHFYYEPTAVVQLAQTPQPTAAVQTDSGKRSQATSPVNPAETSLTPPPETVASHSENEETINGVLPVGSEVAVQVQDASNQTDTPSTSEDETGDVPPLQTTEETDVASGVESIQEQKTSVETNPVVIKPLVVDVSGLELLSNSIEQFESNRINNSDNLTQVDKSSEISVESVNSQIVNGLLTLSETPVKKFSSEELRQDADTRPADEKAAETLQMLCQQSVQLKTDRSLQRVQDVVKSEESENCDKVTNNVSAVVSAVVEKAQEEGVAAMVGNSNVLGGLGLLCALAEQRIMEEGGTTSNATTSSLPSRRSVRSPSCTRLSTDSGNGSASSGVDVNRNYKNRKSERECKKFIASKVMQYFHNGSTSGSNSPQHSACTSPSSSSDLMDAMELNMRMRLAELQRKYREKQRELSKLTPKKASSGESSPGSAPEVPTVVSPVKRGPGRPRKKCNRPSPESPPLSPPVAPPSIPPRPRVGRPPLLKGRELPPPVLEKVTDARPRTRCDTDDYAAPKLKASKLHILKPPTLTASYSKLKPATTLPSNVSTKGLKLPQCNVNLVKLTTNHHANLKVKETSLLKTNSDNKINIMEESRTKLGSVFSSDNSANADKHSVYDVCLVAAFLSCRLPLAHAANHTFGSKPQPLQGESDTHSWFRSVEKPLSISRQPEQDSSSVESAESNASRKVKSLSPSSPLPSLSSSKKRKVGRPKKHPSGSSQEVATETIVAKKPKSKSSIVGFLLSRSRTFGHAPESPYSRPLKNGTEGNNGFLKSSMLKTDDITEHKPNKIRPKLKAEAKVKSWWGTEDDDVEGVVDWPTERVLPAADTSEPLRDTWPKKIEKVEKPLIKPCPEGPGRPRKRKLSNSEGKQSLIPAPKSVKKAATAAAPTTPNVNKAMAPPGREKQCTTEQPASTKKQKRSNSSSSTSGSNNQAGGVACEGGDIPLSVYSKSTTDSLCLLTEEHLNTDKQRALTVMGGLFYAGTVSAIRAPDVYGITLDGERGNRPHIYSREEILRDAILEVRPASIETLTPGTRLCAYWSQQYRCLYPGTVAQPSSPDPELDSHFVNVEFDDGDSGRINLDDIRFLPTNYPILEYDRNPLLSLGKRRRRNSGASCESQSKDRRASAEVPSSTSSSNTIPTKAAAPTIKQDSRLPEASSGNKEVTNLTSSNLAPSASPSTALVSRGSTSACPKKTEGGGDRSDRKRLKKRRREKLKRLMAPDGTLKKRRRKHRCYEEHCHKRHHKRHRKHRHRHGNRNKDSSGSSAESSSKSGHTSGDATSRLSPVLEQLDILEIQQTAIRQLTTTNSSAANTSAVVTTEASVLATPTATTTTSPVTESVPMTATTTSTTSTTPTAATTAAASTASEGEEETDAATQLGKKSKKEKEKEPVKPKKHRDRQPSVESRSKMAAFLPARQLWGWSGRGFKRPGAKGRGKKEFYKAIQRGKETIMVGDCAVFLSTGRPDRPYIGRIESMWEAWGTNMVVRVKWFYHPEETNGCTVQLKYPGALFESPHVDENDVQTISHKCEVLPLDGYTGRLGTEPVGYSTIYDNNDIYYLAGYYDPTTSQLSMKPGVV